MVRVYVAWELQEIWPQSRKITHHECCLSPSWTSLLNHSMPLPDGKALLGSQPAISPKSTYTLPLRLVSSLAPGHAHLPSSAIITVLAAGTWRGLGLWSRQPHVWVLPVVLVSWRLWQVMNCPQPPHSHLPKLGCWEHETEVACVQACCRLNCIAPKFIYRDSTPASNRLEPCLVIKSIKRLFS